MATTRALPDGWVEGFDSNYGRPYYFHKPTRRSSWTKPEFIDQESSVEDGGVSPMASSFRRSQFSNSSLNGSVLGSPAQQRAVNRFNEWLEVFSPEYNRTFFFNKITRESTWVDPRDHSVTGTVQHTQPHKISMVRTEETPAAFLSIWESVGIDAKRDQQPSDRPQTTPTTIDAKSGVIGSRSPAMAAPAHSPGLSGMASSPVEAKRDSKLPPALFQQSFDERSSPGIASSSTSFKGRNDNPLADELEMYARDLERQNLMVNKHATILDPSGRAEAEQLRHEVDELAETAEAVLRADSAKGSARQRRGMKRLLPEDAALSVWGSEPPKVLDVKRAMQDVKSGVKYVKEELKAQGAANLEAEKVDSEGGYYTILGVPTNCDLDTLKKAYRKGMIKCHPDKVSADEKAKAMEKSNMLQNAYNCLSDPWERYLYDYFGLKRYLQNSKVVQCFKNYMLSGIEIIKHPRKGYPRSRWFWISPDFEWLLTGRERILEPTPDERSEMKGVRIKDIHEITRGIATEVLERTGKPKKQSRYFSIVTTERTLDLEAETKERAEFLVSRLSLLILDVQKNKKWLQRHFELKALKEAADMAFRAQRGFAPKPPTEPPVPEQQQQSAGGPNADNSNEPNM